MGRCALITLLLIGWLACEMRGQAVEAATDGLDVTVVIEVTSNFFTVGRRIPTMFLKVFSDGSVECQALQPAGKGPGFVKKKSLTPSEFREFKRVVDQPELLSAKKRYELTHPVFDSWVEWDIKMFRAESVQTVTIADFSPSPARAGAPYPKVVVELGCSISKLREEVYGDEPDYRRSECKEVVRGAGGPPF